MILITGASGNVGREVVKQALTLGLTIRASFRSPDVAAKAPAGLEGVIMDYTKPETIRPALHGVDKIFLVGPPTRHLLALEARFIKEVRASGRKYIVKLSALGGHQSIFPSGHRDSEENVEASGLPHTFLRANAFMQNLVNYNTATIRSRDAFYGCQGNGAVSIIDIRDIAAVAVIVLAATGHEGRSYALTGGEALTNGQIAEKISRVAGRKISYIDLPPTEFKTAMLSAGTPEWSAEAMVDLHRFYRVGKAKRTTEEVERFLGRKPITFDQFAHDYAFAFREEEKVAS
ncbi:MAG: NAD(P)-dependent oxidoreductase [Acidobacteria bacterium]|nr:MAG: NAD(P)-dependent oxidoreductase [Acidobacteriota bacterium]